MPHTENGQSQITTTTTTTNVGLAHDYLLVLRGAERTFAAMADAFPDAPVYTLLYDEHGTQHRFAGHPVQTSYLQRTGMSQNGFRKLLPLMPDAINRLEVAEHDVLVSSSSAFAHGVRGVTDVPHVCYCHSPFRYAWFEERRAMAEVTPALRPVLRRALSRIRQWDRRVAQRVTTYIANSKISQERIARFYDRDAAIVHPPVETHRFHTAEPEDEFLIVCELVPHKRVDLALEAARLAGHRVKVVGDGPEAQRLREEFADVATFVGRVDDSELARLYARALAVVVPNVEEFGIAAVEAQAAGRPVLGSDAGGTRETVTSETGVLTRAGDVAEIAEAMRETDWASFDSRAAVRNADLFSVKRFQREMDQVVQAAAKAA